MNNKLGISEYRLDDIEKKIVSLKLELLDESFTFNKGNLNLEYLINLNKFLFGDFYFDNQIGLRDNLIEISIVDDKINLINNLYISNIKDIDSILNTISDIWYIQPFKIGNTRTLIGFLKVLNCAFSLNLEIDVTKEIISSPSMFKLNNIVNQKRLTKHK